MEDQIGTILHWSNQKEPKQATSEILQYSACGEANEYTNVKI